MRFFKGLGSRLQAMAFVALACCFALLPGVASAQTGGGASLPTEQFNVSIVAFVPLILTAFATVVTAVVGGYFLIQLVRGGMMWARRYTTK